MQMIGIRQFFTRQNFPNPDSSKFSTVKILCHTVLEASAFTNLTLNCSVKSSYLNIYCIYMSMA